MGFYMNTKTARQIIEEMDLPEGKQHNFVQVYESGFELLKSLGRKRDLATVMVYLHLIQNADRNSGATYSDVESMAKDTGLSGRSVYRAIKILTNAGHLRSRYKNLFEINPEGSWKGYTKRKNNAMFMMSDEKAMSKGVRLRLNPGSKHAKAITVPATFEPVF